MALVLIGTVADFAKVEEYGTAEGILLLTLVEADVAATTQLRILQPLQRKESPFQLSQFAQREGQTAEFERDLLRERVRSGIAAARKRGVVFGRRPGQRVKADRYAPKVLKLVGEGQSYREISHRLGLSKNTVLDIVKRNRATP